MTALQPRVWAEHDRVARVDRRAPSWHWQLGTVTGLDGPHWLIVRWNDETPLESYVSCVGADDRNLLRADDIPVDERHWLPEKTRDQLVRQEAAAQLRAMAAELPYADAASEALFATLADLLNDVVGPGGGGWLPGGGWVSKSDLAHAARALLTPAPTPARTP